MHNTMELDMTHLPTLDDLDAVLARLGAKLAAWQLQALYLGAQASTSFTLGPQRLLDRILGEETDLGASLNEVNANLSVIMGFWNRLLVAKQEGTLELSSVKSSEPPTAAELAALAERRHDELAWFIRGLDAGGDDPIEFGEEGEEILRHLAEASAFFKSFHDLLAKNPDESLASHSETARNLASLSDVVLLEMLRFTELSDAIRAEAIAECEAREGRATADGTLIETVKVARGETCPCGSGKKWSRCCGAVMN